MELGLTPFACSDDFSICVYNVATVCLIGVTDVLLKNDCQAEPLEGAESLTQFRLCLTGVTGVLLKTECRAEPLERAVSLSQFSSVTDAAQTLSQF